MPLLFGSDAHCINEFVVISPSTNKLKQENDVMTSAKTFDLLHSGDTLGKGVQGGACDSNLTLHALMMKYEDDDISFARVRLLH
jgi:hypothetical protein